MLAQSWLSVPPAPACDFEIAIIGIGFAREQRFQFAPRHLGLQPFQRRFRLGDGFVVFFGLAQLNHGELVVELLLDAANSFELVVKRVAFAHHALRARLVVPQIGVFGLFVQLGQTALRGIDVKDASSAALTTA